jgi:hypothetical protein
MNNFIGDELANKVRYLYEALNQAQDIIKHLEYENHRLQDVLINLASEENKEGYVLDSEAFNESANTI